MKCHVPYSLLELGLLPKIEQPSGQSKKGKCTHPLDFWAHEGETKQLLRERGKRRRGRMRRERKRKRRRNNKAIVV